MKMEVYNFLTKKVHNNSLCFINYIRSANYSSVPCNVRDCLCSSDSCSSQSEVNICSFAIGWCDRNPL